MKLGVISSAWMQLLMLLHGLLFWFTWTIILYHYHHDLHVFIPFNAFLYLHFTLFSPHPLHHSHRSASLFPSFFSPSFFLNAFHLFGMVSFMGKIFSRSGCASASISHASSVFQVGLKIINIEMFSLRPSRPGFHSILIQDRRLCGPVRSLLRDTGIKSRHRALFPSQAMALL